MTFRIVYIFSVVVVLFSSCSKEPTPYHITLDRCIHEMQFPCDPDYKNGDFVLHAVVNGQEFCLNEHTESYWFMIQRFAGSITPASDPRIQVGSQASIISSNVQFGFSPHSFTGRHHKSNPHEFRPGEVEPLFTIRTPRLMDSVIYPTHYYIDQFIKGKGELTIEKVHNPISHKGWVFDFYWGCRIPPERRGFNDWGYPRYDSTRTFTDVNPATFRSFGRRFGKVLPHLRVEEYEREDMGEYIRYHITFGFEGDLNYEHSGYLPLKVRDGRLDMRFELPKNDCLGARMLFRYRNNLVIDIFDR